MRRREFLKELCTIAPILSIIETVSQKNANSQEKKNFNVQLRKNNKNNIWGKFFGFNLLNYFMVHGKKPFQEEEFALIHRLGFNFVRLPMDYRCWTDEKSPYQIQEQDLKEIDKAIEWGKNITFMYV